MRSGPDRGKRHQMREVEAVHKRLSYIGVDLAGQARQPCFDRVDGFADAGKTKHVHDPLDGADLRVDCGALAIRHRHSRSQIAERHMLASQRLQSTSRSSANATARNKTCTTV